VLSSEFVDTSSLGIKITKVEGIRDRFTPRVKVTLQIEYKPPQELHPNTVGPGFQLTIIEHRLEMSAAGFVLGSAGPQYERLQPNRVTSSTYDVTIPRNVLESIEERRQDDLPVIFNLGGIAVETRPGTPPQRAYSFSISIVDNLSQARWTKLLRETGFQDIWIVEVSKPAVPQTAGLEKAQKFLTDAETEILEGSPENAVTDCRKAMDVLDPFLKEHWKSVSEEIDRNSVEELNRPTKSERISVIRDSIRAWSNIGPHADKYPISLEDARLCYRLTVTLFSYVSRLANRPSV
jgi:hypothetical protein